MNIFALSSVWKRANDATSESLRFSHDEMAELLGLARRFQNNKAVEGIYLTGVKTIGIEFRTNPERATILNITKNRDDNGHFVYNMSGSEFKSFQTINFPDAICYARAHIDDVLSDPVLFQTLIQKRLPDHGKLKIG